MQLADSEVKLTIGLIHSASSRSERRWFKGALAVTQTHLIAYAKQMELLHVDLADLKRKHVDVNADNPACLCVTTPKEAGQPAMEMRFYTPHAERYLSLLAG